MKQKLLVLCGIAIFAAIGAALYQNCAYLDDEFGNTPLHSLIFDAEANIRATLKLLHDQEAIAAQEHTKTYKQWQKMLKRNLLTINSNFVADLRMLQSNACFSYMLEARNNDGLAVKDLLDTFPRVDREDAEYLGIRYHVTNRFYDTLHRIIARSAEKQDE